ncbi:MAG: signal peptidase II [Roseburia sp.]|nr:signal peptidase II [Roseburia sp.]MCM1279251.1 signal peptidase II [Robinsoniella sp.]
MKKGKKAVQLFLDFIFLALLISIDQISKVLAVEYLKGRSNFILIKDVFVLHYLENKGAAFGMLQNQKMFFIFSAIVILTLFLFVLIKTPLEKKYRYTHICLVLISAGACGNMIDRLRYNYVVDFLYFELIDFPVFNVADIFVTIGTIFLIILYLFYYKEEDLQFLKLRMDNSKLKF